MKGIKDNLRDSPKLKRNKKTEREIKHAIDHMKCSTSSMIATLTHYQAYLLNLESFFGKEELDAEALNTEDAQSKSHSSKERYSTNPVVNATSTKTAAKSPKTEADSAKSTKTVATSPRPPKTAVDSSKHSSSKTVSPSYNKHSSPKPERSRSSSKSSSSSHKHSIKVPSPSTSKSHGICDKSRIIKKKSKMTQSVQVPGNHGSTNSLLPSIEKIWGIAVRRPGGMEQCLRGAKINKDSDNETDSHEYNDNGSYEYNETDSNNNEIGSNNGSGSTNENDSNNESGSNNENGSNAGSSSIYNSNYKTSNNENGINYENGSNNETAFNDKSGSKSFKNYSSLMESERNKFYGSLKSSKRSKKSRDKCKESSKRNNSSHGSANSSQKSDNKLNVPNTENNKQKIGSDCPRPSENGSCSSSKDTNDPNKVSHAKNDRSQNWDWTNLNLRSCQSSIRSPDLNSNNRTVLNDITTQRYNYDIPKTDNGFQKLIINETQKSSNPFTKTSIGAKHLVLSPNKYSYCKITDGFNAGHPKSSSRFSDTSSTYTCKELTAQTLMKSRVTPIRNHNSMLVSIQRQRIPHTEFGPDKHVTPHRAMPQVLYNHNTPDIAVHTPPQHIATPMPQRRVPDPYFYETPTLLGTSTLKEHEPAPKRFKWYEMALDTAKNISIILNSRAAPTNTGSII